jgi:peptidyl-tRNA hydrolase
METHPTVRTVPNHLKSAKLYLVVRADLPPAQQAVQAAHALTEYLLEHKEGAFSWYSTSNTIALLSVSTEDNLRSLAHKARRKGLMLSEFREPDRSHELTAVAFEPKAKSLLRSLNLALL